MHFWFIAVKILEKFPMLPFHCALTYVSFWDSFNFRKACGNISNSGTKKYWEILFCCTQSSLSIGFTTHEIFPSTCVHKNVRVKMAGLIVNLCTNHDTMALVYHFYYLGCDEKLVNCTWYCGENDSKSYVQNPILKFADVYDGRIS